MFSILTMQIVLQMEKNLRERHGAKTEYLMKIANQGIEEDTSVTQEASKEESEEKERSAEKSNENTTEEKFSQTTEIDLSFISQVRTEIQAQEIPLLLIFKGRRRASSRASCAFFVLRLWLLSQRLWLQSHHFRVFAGKYCR